MPSSAAARTNQRQSKFAHSRAPQAASGLTVEDLPLATAGLMRCRARCPFNGRAPARATARRALDDAQHRSVDGIGIRSAGAVIVEYRIEHRPRPYRRPARRPISSSSRDRRPTCRRCPADVAALSSRSSRWSNSAQHHEAHGRCAARWRVEVPILLATPWRCSRRRCRTATATPRRTEIRCAAANHVQFGRPGRAFVGQFNSAVQPRAWARSRFRRRRCD